MITCAIVNSKSTEISFTGVAYVEEFKRKFTTLDCNVASRAIFPNEVMIEYGDDNHVRMVPRERVFSFIDINTMVNHMLRHGFTFKKEVLSSILEQASLLDLGEMFVLHDSLGKPSYVVGMSQDTVTVSPVSADYLDFGEGASLNFVRSLDGNPNVSGVEVDQKGRVIRIVIRGNVSEALNDISEAFAEVGAVDSGGKGAVLQQLISRAFDDLTGYELRIIKNIASCSVSHPLSKYRDAARHIEKILVGLRDKQLDADTLRQLGNALEGRGEFSSLPTVLTKGFSRLNKDFGPTLQHIIDEASRDGRRSTN
ncbi:MAG: hypothetical protein AB8U44_02090 [Aaplasma endosymbiont of Hyalomma asiaticum]